MAPVWAVDHHAGGGPRVLADDRGRARSPCRSTRSSAWSRRSRSCAGASAASGLLDALDRPAVRDLAGRHRPRAAARLRTHGWLGVALADTASRSSSRVPGIVLATIFVSLPVRRARGRARAARDRRRAGAGRRDARRLAAGRPSGAITLPAIRWGIAYGVVLTTARAIGEFGAVSVVSGRIAGETETLTLLVEKRFQNFDLAGAYAASALLGAHRAGDAAGHDAAQAAKGPRHDRRRRASPSASATSSRSTTSRSRSATAR